MRNLFLLVFLFVGTANAFPSAENVRYIRSVADKVSPLHLLDGIVIRTNVTIQGPAWSLMEGWRPVIEYNPTLLGRFPKTVTNLVFYHELGHIHLGHIMSLKIYPERAEEFEFEADIFAATLYKRLEKTDDGLEDFFKFMDGQTKTKPSGPERAKIFRSILFAR